MMNSQIYRTFLSGLTCILMLSAVSSCDRFSGLGVDPIEPGIADLSNYLAVGNSFTAGYQNNALYRSGQEYSYPNLLARQFRTPQEFIQPYISDPGLGNRIELTSLNPLETRVNPEQGQPVNQGEKPFHNLGIPGGLLVDYANPNNIGNLKERATDPDHPAFNPFYQIVIQPSELSKSAPRIHNEVVALNPTLVTFWMGTNDIMGFVASGGEGSSFTDPATFAQLYQLSAQLLASLETDVVVYTVPRATSLPFVFNLRRDLRNDNLISFNQSTGVWELTTGQGSLPIYIRTDGGTRKMQLFDFPLMSASGYFSAVFTGEIAPPVTSDTAIPDFLVLDGPVSGGSGDSELALALGAVNQYNTAIRSIANSAGFLVMDAQVLFSTVAGEFLSEGGGYASGSGTLRPIPGELFSFDGIHTGNVGNAVLANETIKLLNSNFGSNIPLIDISSIPEGFPTAVQ